MPIQIVVFNFNTVKAGYCRVYNDYNVIFNLNGVREKLWHRLHHNFLDINNINTSLDNKYVKLIEIMLY